MRLSYLGHTQEVFESCDDSIFVQRLVSPELISLRYWMMAYIVF